MLCIWTIYNNDFKTIAIITSAPNLASVGYKSRDVKESYFSSDLRTS